MAVTPTPYYGSSLENLDYWGPLDGLPYSLDSDIWPDAAAVALKGDSVSPGKAVAAPTLALKPIESNSPTGTHIDLDFIIMLDTPLESLSPSSSVVKQLFIGIPPVVSMSPSGAKSNSGFL